MPTRDFETQPITPQERVAFAQRVSAQIATGQVDARRFVQELTDFGIRMEIERDEWKEAAESGLVNQFRAVPPVTEPSGSAEFTLLAVMRQAHDILDAALDDGDVSNARGVLCAELRKHGPPHGLEQG